MESFQIHNTFYSVHNHKEDNKASKAQTNSDRRGEENISLKNKIPKKIIPGEELWGDGPGASHHLREGDHGEARGGDLIQEDNQDQVDIQRGKSTIFLLKFWFKKQ